MGRLARVEAATQAEVEDKPEREVSSFTKSLFLGEIHEELVFPWPAPDPDEQERIRELNAAAREIGARMDHREIEEKRWIGDDVIRELGEAGLCGLYVDERYGGQGLSQTGYARVFETFAQIDATLSIVLGVHQSIGFKGIHMFGTEEQKERFLPDLAAAASSPASRSPSPRRAPTPTRSSRARCSSPTARGCSTARSATSATARRATCSPPSPAARSTARTATSR